jgi:hypothetical protein
MDDPETAVSLTSVALKVKETTLKTMLLNDYWQPTKESPIVTFKYGADQKWNSAMTIGADVTVLTVS